MKIPFAFRIAVEAVSDERGAFGRRFCADTFCSRGLEVDFVPRSISFNRKAGTLLGFHFRTSPHLETKLVRSTRGAIFDVIVDLRDGSTTNDSWHAEELTAINRAIFYLPWGVAHGFQVIRDDSEVDYEITATYVRGFERRFGVDDAALSIPLARPRHNRLRSRSRVACYTLGDPGVTRISASGASCAFF